MASALEAVLNLKEVERQRQEANSNGIANAIQMFNVARQQAQENEFRRLEIAQRGNQGSDLNIIQRIAATKGVKPTEDRTEMLNSLAEAVGEEREVITIDPLTGQPMESFTTGPRSIVRKGVMNPEQIKERATAEGEGKAIVKDIETTSKLGGAVKRLAILNQQFNKALPSGDKTPLEQRISGNYQKFAAKAGLTDNKELVALQRNIRPMAITMIRAFGEVGNLSESEQQGAIDTVNQADLTDKERIESTRQFIQFALAGARPESIKLLRDRKDISGILDSFGVDLGSNEEENFNPKTHKKQVNKKTGEIRIVPR